MQNNNDMQQKITVRETASVVLVFVICWLLNIYGCLLASVSTLAVYYQHARQCFALVFELTALPRKKHTSCYSIL